MKSETEPNNPFPYGTVAWSNWESENDRKLLAERTYALLAGELEPQNEQDKNYLRDMGGVKGARAGWPKKWTVCKRCHAEWQATGFPTPVSIGGVTGKVVDQWFRKNRFGSWLFPSICEVCEDELRAVKAPPKTKDDKDDAKTAKKAKKPYRETESDDE